MTKVQTLINHAKESHNKYTTEGITRKELQTRFNAIKKYLNEPRVKEEMDDIIELCDLNHELWKDMAGANEGYIIDLEHPGFRIHYFPSTTGAEGDPFSAIKTMLTFAARLEAI